jgi:hypothetical protein
MVDCKWGGEIFCGFLALLESCPTEDKPAMNRDGLITAHPDAVFTRLGPDSATVLNLVTKRYYSLNGTGLRIWELIASEGSIAGIAAALHTEYEIGLEAALARVESFLGELHAEGLVEVG